MLLKTFYVSILCVIILDLLWLGIIAGSIYKEELRPILRIKGDSFTPIWAAVIPIYILLALGFALFVIPSANSVAHAAGLGALLGLIIYGVYDFTNMALLAQWTWKITIIDLAWGTLLGTIVSSVTKYIVAKI